MLRRAVRLMLPPALVLAAPAAAATDTWTRLGPDGLGVSALAPDPSAPGTVYAGSLTAGVHVSTDTGASWTPRLEGLTDRTVRALAVTRAGGTTRLVAATGRGVAVSEDGGRTWRTTADARVDAVAADPASPAVVFADALHSVDGGLTWSAAPATLAGRDVISLAVASTTPRAVYAGTDAGVYRSTDGGTRWSTRAAGLPAGMRVSAVAVDRSNANRLYAADGTRLFTSANAGGAWTALTPPVSGATITTVMADPATTGRVLLATTAGVLASPDAGANWVPVRGGLPTTPVTALAAEPGTAGAMYAGTPEGVLASTDHGFHWTASVSGLSGLTAGALTVMPTAGGVTTLAGVDGRLMRRAADGAWSPVDLGPSTAFAGTVTSDPRNPMVAFASARDTDGAQPDTSGLMRSQDGGLTWSPLPTGPAGAVTVHPRTGIISAVTGGRGVSRSPDGGMSWTRSDAGIDALSIGALAGDPTDPSVLFAATAEGAPAAPGGGMHRSTDGGRTWTHVATAFSPTPLTAVAVDPRAPGTVFAGAAGGVYRSTDAGVRWSTLTTAGGTDLLLDPGIAGTVYAASPDGVLVSRDGGGTWAQLGAGLRNRPVTDIDLDPVARSLYASGLGGVWRIDLTPAVVTASLPAVGCGTACDETLPGVVTLAMPRLLGVRRDARGVTVRWRAVPGAVRYVVRVTFRRYHPQRTTTARTLRLAVPWAAARRAPVLVTVVPVTRDGVRGPTLRIRVAARR